MAEVGDTLRVDGQLLVEIHIQVQEVRSSVVVALRVRMIEPPSECGCLLVQKVNATLLHYFQSPCSSPSPSYGSFLGRRIQRFEGLESVDCPVKYRGCGRGLAAATRLYLAVRVLWCY